MRETTSIMLVGVGGQGTVLVTAILASGLMAAGWDVKTAEVHGMSQRGGSVSTQLRFGDRVHSPIMGKGGADVLVAFEKLEALRWLEYLKPSGHVVVNDWEISSAPILIGRSVYPAGVVATLKSKAATVVVEAQKIAAGLGDARAMNVVLLGALVETLKVSGIDWDSAIEEAVKPKYLALNVAAFRAGRESVRLDGKPRPAARKPVAPVKKREAAAADAVRVPKEKRR